MTDGRIHLPVGATVEFDSGDVYRITGDPLGCGGGSILYPARKQHWENGILQTEGIAYVLKECYPAPSGYSYQRMESGEIAPVHQSSEDLCYLQRVQLMQQEESAISQDIYRTASRMLPIRGYARSVVLTLPGRQPVPVNNTVTLMDSLAEKGQSLTDWIRKQKRFTPAETFRIIQQVLFALQEVHRAGYLHLDIQDGNVFLRGTLEQKNELVTLIDFGCARKLEREKTEPIRDRVIFTTQGFSAPEILLRNDGSLRLGPEADLYSVGCLALYLLTGQRANVRELMANRTGVYLRPNQLRRIQCPGHLTDTMQQILSRALAKEPENRYHSAEEMLEDVTALAEALQPKGTALGAVKYDAFVCYRHGAVDSAAALTLQRALENYRAPNKGVGQKKRPFSRVFVDEGELSSCADFGQQIREALKNSGWLIVICSPDTPLSPWVQLEIDTFLEYHDRSRILAVLIGGDPESAFPPQLKGGAGGAGEIFAAHALSSTPREAEQQLRGDALLKIAAPMLGTTYDMLKQRQKIYRLQRLAAVTAVFLLAAVGFAAYAANRARVIAEQAVRIREEYERALINESLFLAEQAEKKLAGNDPLGAIELALQALPSETQERPVLPEAEYALGQALGIYKTPVAAEDTATPLGKINTDCPYFFLSVDGAYLYAWDDSVNGMNSMIQCWDAEELTLRWEVSLDYWIAAHPLICASGDLYILGYSSLRCLEGETGREKWSLELSGARGAVLSEDGAELLVISKEDTQESDPQLHLKAAVYDTDTGRQLRQNDIRIGGNLRIEGEICASGDLRYVAIPTADDGSREFTWYSYNSLYLADLESETCHMLLDSQTQIRDMRFTEDGLTLIREAGYTLAVQYNALYEYYDRCTYWLERFDPGSRSLLWRQEITDYFESGGICEILPTDYHDGSAEGKGLMYIFEDHCVLLDRESGKIIRQYTLPAAAMTVSLTEKGFETVNADGSYTVTGFGTDRVIHIPYFSSGISEICRTGGDYFIQNETMADRDHSICKYRMNRYDDSYAVHFTADSDTWMEYPAAGLEGSGKVLLTKDAQLCLVDTATEEVWQCRIPEEYDFSVYRTVGVSAEENRLYWYVSGQWDDPECWIDHAEYYALDFATGQISLVSQPRQPSRYVSVGDTVFTGDRMLLAVTCFEEDVDCFCLYSWDMDGGTLEECFRYSLPVTVCEEAGKTSYHGESYLYESLDWDPENGQACFALQDEKGVLTKLVAVEPVSGTAEEISLGITAENGNDAYQTWQSSCCQWNSSGTQVIFRFDGRLRVVDLTENRLWEIPGAEETVSVRYSPDGQYILAVSQKAVLSKYRAADGVCCASVNMTEYCGSLDTVDGDDWTWVFVDDSTLLTVSNYGGFLLDISGEALSMKATVDQCVDYDPAEDRFVVAERNSYYGKPTTVGSFRRYTVEDLIRKAKEIRK